MNARTNLIELLAVFGGNKTLLARALATSPRSIGRWIDREHPIREEMATVIGNMLLQYRPELFETSEEIQDTPAPDADTVVPAQAEPRMVLLVEAHVQGQYIMTVAKSVENTDQGVRVLGEDGCLIIMSATDNQIEVSRVPSTHERVQFYYRVQNSFSGNQPQMYEIDNCGWHLREPSPERILELRQNGLNDNKIIVLSPSLTTLVLW